MRNVLLFLFAVLMILIVNYEHIQRDINHIPFTLENNLPMIEGTINGYPATFLVDTGANISIINLRYLGYGYSTTRTPNTVNGIGGEVIKYDLRDVLIEVNGTIINVEVSGLVLSNHHWVGVIGTDWLIKNKKIIDFEKKIIK